MLQAVQVLLLETHHPVDKTTISNKTDYPKPEFRLEAKFKRTVGLQEHHS